MHEKKKNVHVYGLDFKIIYSLKNFHIKNYRLFTSLNFLNLLN
jgi:hypothetical protein